MCPARFADRLERADTDTASERSEQQPVGGLMVGAVDDRAELEADRVAGEVITRLHGLDGGAHEHSVDCSHGGVRRSAAPSGGAEVGYGGGELSGGLSRRIQGKRGGGSTLPDDVRARLEDGFGGSLAAVRIHADAESAELSRAVSARAFTAGQDIFFGAGEYRPDTPEGEQVLAHEVAHTRQHGGDARRTPVRRLWDFNQPRLAFNTTQSIRTLSNRFIWFLTDNAGDDMVVKLENQPVGLGQLTGELHTRFGTAGSVVQKRMDNTDIGDIANLLLDPNIATGPTWAVTANQLYANFPVPGLDVANMDNTNDDDYGRQMAAYQLQNSGNDVLAMSKAHGDSAEDVAAPDNNNPNVSLFRTYLEDPNHAEQLGKITAVDLFMGNDDRVTAGNMGNWYYDQHGAVELIDHVDQGSGMAAKFAQGLDLTSWKQRCGAQLNSANLDQTAVACVRELVRAAGQIAGDVGIRAWIDQVQPSGRTRREEIATNLRNGLRDQRKELIKTFTATRHTIGGGNRRALKKAIKVQARQTAQEDTGHVNFNNNPNEYYDVMKARAAWMKKH